MKLLLLFLLVSHSLMAQQLVFVFLHHKADKPQLPKEQVDKIMEGHMANIKKMADEGKLLVAGPFEGGGGIFIFNSQKVDQVKDWISNDPGVKNERWNIEILNYNSRTGKPQLVKEPYQMTTYGFVRFTSHQSNLSVEAKQNAAKKHIDFLSELKKSGGVVAEGQFGDTAGGILIVKNDFDLKQVEADPAIVQGLLGLDIKKWFVAKGAFGEN